MFRPDILIRQKTEELYSIRPRCKATLGTCRSVIGRETFCFLLFIKRKDGVKATCEHSRCCHTDSIEVTEQSPAVHFTPTTHQSQVTMAYP